jgi:hypothetical protein
MLYFWDSSLTSTLGDPRHMMALFMKYDMDSSATRQKTLVNKIASKGLEHLHIVCNGSRVGYCWCFMPFKN